MARRRLGRRADRRRVDLVKAGLIPPGDPTGRSSQIAGLVVRRGKSLEVEPLFQPGPPLPIVRGPHKPQPGELVLFTFSYGFRADIIRSLGHSGELEDVMEALLADSGIRRGFSPVVLAEAEAAAARREEDEAGLVWGQGGRVDLRDLFTFTIDPVMAQDFDDALSFERTSEGSTKVYVHIADVSFYVREGTALDREAMRRGNSVYVAKGVEPMLPPILSSEVCSLKPGEDRKTVTVEMDVDDHGIVRSTRFYRSLIRSDRRLDYEQVERMFRGEEAVDSQLTGPLAWGRTLAGVLREQRYQRGTLRIESTEPEFEWDESGRVCAADPGEELESHWLIEVFMILANEQVAAFLERERIPTVYRVHDLPDPFRVEHLLDVLASLGLPTPDFDPLTATSDEVRRVTRQTAEWIDRHTPADRGKAALMQQVLRAQARAVYQTANIGHFGLASSTYCHFTSPIRRYPDLLVHRGLLGALGLERPPTTAFLADWAEHCSLTEREADRIELKADDIVLAHLLKRRLDEGTSAGAVFEGQVMSLTRRGLFVLFDRVFQGYLSVRELPEDDYRLNELETALVGRRTGRAYRLADLVPVRVLAVDPVRGRVDLTLADEETERASGTRHAGDVAHRGTAAGNRASRGRFPTTGRRGRSGAPRRPPSGRRGRR